MNRNIIPCLLILFLSSSCRTYEIKDKDLELIPYLGNEILVFESDEKQLDTIFINGFHNYMADSDPLAILPDKLEFYTVKYEFKDSNFDRYLQGELIKIQGSKNHELFLWFSVNIDNINGNCGIAKKEWMELPNKSWTFNEMTLKDVKILESDIFTGSYPERIFWSMSEGLLGIESEEGTWKLKKKYVP